MVENTRPKQRGGFAPGRSGNPAGRPHGAKNKTTIMVEQLMADDAGEIVRSVIDMAKRGDIGAARIILDRVAPVRKGRPVTIDLPEARAAADLLEASAALIAAMAQGELTPDEAATIAGVLEIHRKTLETLELEQRISALEAKKHGNA